MSNSKEFIIVYVVHQVCSEYPSLNVSKDINMGLRWQSGRHLTRRSAMGPSLPHLHAEVSLGKMLNLEFPLIEKVLPIDALGA